MLMIYIYADSIYASIYHVYTMCLCAYILALLVYLHTRAYTRSSVYMYICRLLVYCYIISVLIHASYVSYTHVIYTRSHLYN